MRLGDLDRAHRWREVGAGGEPVPDLVQAVLQIGLELRNRHRVHAGRALVRPDFLPRLPDSPLRDIKRLARCFQLVHAIPPGALPVDQTNHATNDPAPSLRPRYRDFSTTANRSASASRDGTQPLAVQPRSRKRRSRRRSRPSPRRSSRPCWRTRARNPGGAARTSHRLAGPIALPGSRRAKCAAVGLILLHPLIGADLGVSLAGLGA